MVDVDNQDPQSAAESLRAAALRSRKRPRVGAGQPLALPQRLSVEQTMQLDYGQEEIATPAPIESFATQSMVPSASDDPLFNSTPEFEDGQIREEGEISDTEEARPHPLPARPTSPPPKFRRLETSSKDNLTSRPVPTSPVIGSNLPPGPSTFLDSPFMPSKPPSDSEHTRHSSPTFSHSLILETPTYRLDADHVRPGLAMNQDQYTIAKDTVLDLLGWGVPPEYLIHCGVTRQTMYYVFTELNLRMPANLDTTGLIPYPTPEMMSLISTSPLQSIRSHVSASTIMPPPVIMPSHGEFSSPIVTSGHTPDRPGTKLAARLGLRIPSIGESTDVKVEPISPSAADSPLLHMIEQQRRQELLARKAVFASRKAKRSDFPGDPSLITDRDVERAHVDVTDTVEDFLKSIPAEIDNPTALRATRYASPDPMDVDNVSPASFARQSISSEGPSSSTLPASADSTTSETRSTVSPANNSPPLLGHSTTPPLDTYSGALISANSMTGDYMAPSSSVTPTSASTNSVHDGNGLQRRGTKRPVAADFVDFDHGPGTSRAASGNGYPSNGYPQLVPLHRRKTGSFAGVSGTRRCVIDLSDSEDDSDGEGTSGPALHDGLSSYSQTVILARTSRMSGNGTFNNGEGCSTPPNLHSTNINAPLGMSPAALAEKEEEIRKMRQMIAQKELRLKKLAAMSGKTTPMSQATESPTTGGVTTSVNALKIVSVGESGVSVKQEDNAVFLHSGDAGDARSFSEQADVIMRDMQDNHEPTAVLQSDGDSVVIPNEETTSGESRNDLTSANETIGSSRFFTSPTSG